MSSPLISVVIPAYNAANTLRVAVESVVQQTVQDFEIIIVDDGSKDDTAEVARSFDDSRINLIVQSNRGASAARNTGIRAGTGKYVGLLDADDLWLPQKLERQLNVLNTSKKIRAVQSGVYLVDDSLNIVAVRNCVESKDAFLETLLLQNLPGLMSTLLVESEALEEIGLFDTEIMMIEDWDLAIRLTRYCPLACIEDPLSLYRQYPGNRSKDMSHHIVPGLFILDRVFNDGSLPDHIKRQKGHVYATFFNMLCGGAFNTGRYVESIKWGIKAVRKYPPILAYIASTPFRKMARRSMSKKLTPEVTAAINEFKDLQNKLSSDV